jgi:ABC-type nitrate/sulfonate/bicarbonate transport system permease component
MSTIIATATSPEATGRSQEPGTREFNAGWSGILLSSLKSVFLNAAPVIALLIVWELLARSGAMNPALFPSLEKVWARLVSEAQSGLLWLDISLSLFRLFVGAILGILVGTALGLLMGMSRIVERVLAPPMYFFLAVPGVALFPIVILWFGLSNLTLISVVWFEATVTVMVAAWTGVKTVDASLIRAGRAMGAKGLTLFFEVLVPGSLPSLIAGYRMAFSRAWRIVIAGEMIVALNLGLGYRIFLARDFLASDMMYAGILVVGVLGLLVERFCLRSIELSTVQRWGMLRE